MRKRPAARLIVLNPEDSVLLFHFVFTEGPLSGTAYWATPGGALVDGESYRRAARRELYEETGIVEAIGEEIAQRTIEFRIADGDFVSADERYFMVRVAGNAINQEMQEPLEASVMKAYRWWRVAELKSTSAIIYPEDLAQIVEQQIGHVDDAERHGTTTPT